MGKLRSQTGTYGKSDKTIADDKGEHYELTRMNKKKSFPGEGCGRLCEYRKGVRRYAYKAD
ncbi:MAG TPA: hypothetical protein VG367_06225 [Mucilaginibacter sp.]|nr:hypothetical protein [Mucilaginibacter sp.]